MKQVERAEVKAIAREFNAISDELNARVTEQKKVTREIADTATDLTGRLFKLARG